MKSAVLLVAAIGCFIWGGLILHNGGQEAQTLAPGGLLILGLILVTLAGATAK